MRSVRVRCDGNSGGEGKEAGGNVRDVARGKVRGVEFWPPWGNKVVHFCYAKNQPFRPLFVFLLGVIKNSTARSRAWRATRFSTGWIFTSSLPSSFILFSCFDGKISIPGSQYTKGRKRERDRRVPPIPPRRLVNLIVSFFFPTRRENFEIEYGGIRKE